MAKGTCSIAGCERAAHDLGLCGAHAYRLRRHGDVRADIPIRPQTRPFYERLLDGLRLVVAGDDCHLWEGACSAAGYGVLRVEGQPVGVHRIAWQLTRGPIPEGLHVLHDCDVRYAVGDLTYRRCCNPLHLWLGDQAANNRDAFAKGRMDGRHDAALRNAQARQDPSDGG